MTRKNVKISPDTHERLASSKPDNSTWDGYFHPFWMPMRILAPKPPATIVPIQRLKKRQHYTKKEKLGEQARDLRSQVDFERLLQESDGTSEATAALIAELTADRVVEKLEIETND